MCKKCGPVGHSTFQCRNFLSAKEEGDKVGEGIKSGVISGCWISGRRRRRKRRTTRLIRLILMIIVWAETNRGLRRRAGHIAIMMTEFMILVSVVGILHSSTTLRKFDFRKSAEGLNIAKRDQLTMAIERKIIILENEKYVYEKCNGVIKNMINNRYANVNRAQPFKGKRLIHGDYERNVLDHKKSKRLKENPTKHKEPGPVNRNNFKHVTENTVIKEVKEEIEERYIDDDTSTELEILDNDEVIKRGTSLFVPSTIYRRNVNVSKASCDYRERVLNVLKKPFDKEEYRRLSEEVKIYLAKYPDLKKKLNENRYKRLTRMTILRGFFYWLQNVMLDEAFKPWKDSQCLAVQPGSVQEN